MGARTPGRVGCVTNAYSYRYVVIMAALIMDRDFFNGSLQNSSSFRRKLNQSAPFSH